MFDRIPSSTRFHRSFDPFVFHLILTDDDEFQSVVVGEGEPVVEGGEPRRRGRRTEPIAADGGDPSLLGESEAKEVSGTITEWKKRAMRYGLEIFFLNGVNKFFITSACAIH